MLKKTNDINNWLLQEIWRMVKMPISLVSRFCLLFIAIFHKYNFPPHSYLCQSWRVVVFYEFAHACNVLTHFTTWKLQTRTLCRDNHQSFSYCCNFAWGLCNYVSCHQVEKELLISAMNSKNNNNSLPYLCDQRHHATLQDTVPTSFTVACPSSRNITHHIIFKHPFWMENLRQPKRWHNRSRTTH